MKVCRENLSLGECFQISVFKAPQRSPTIEMTVLPEPYSRPIKVAALIDTEASYTIMNPEILPPHFFLEILHDFGCVGLGALFGIVPLLPTDKTSVCLLVASLLSQELVFLAS